MVDSSPLIRTLNAKAYWIPTEEKESDGTLEWNHTTAIVVQVEAAGKFGIGYTYAASGVAQFIEKTLKPKLLQQNCFDIPRLWDVMIRETRNLGRPGWVSMAISAVDVALWDLKAKILNLPIHRLLGAARSSVPVYGSGGFTSYSPKKMQSQLTGWVEMGILRVKMKVGTSPNEDPQRVSLARKSIGVHSELYVDANGAYSRKQALFLAQKFREEGVSWFEEPVSSDDLEGLRLIRDRAPSGMDITAGEYGYDFNYFRRMLEANAVDVLQIDVTRCGGISGFIKALSVAESFQIPVSTHCAPSLHVALGCSNSHIRHLEYFHDHVRAEKFLFDGVIEPKNGSLSPRDDLDGFGLILKTAEAERYAA